jgi:hypothetical protein
LPAAVIRSAAQEKANAICSVVYHYNLAVYLTLEPSESSEKDLHLVFHNNLSCTLKVEREYVDLYRAGKPFKLKVTKTADRTLHEYEIDWSGEDKVRLPLLYDFQAGIHKAPEAANYSRDKHLIYAVEIPPRQSVIFGVSRAHLKKGFSVSVRFYYPWDHGPGGSEDVVHRVYFYSDDIPK